MGQAERVDDSQRLAFTLNETAERLGFSRYFVLERIRKGDLNAIRRGRRFLITPAALKSFLSGGENGTKAKQ